MGIPGSPFSGLLPSNRSSAASIPRVSESNSADLHFSSKDRFLLKDESEERNHEDAAFLLPEGSTSFTEFVKTINKSIDIFERSGSEPGSENESMNEGIEENAGILAGVLHKLRSRIWMYLRKRIKAEKKADALIKIWNRKVACLAKCSRRKDVFIRLCIDEFNRESGLLNIELEEINQIGMTIGIDKITLIEPVISGDVFSKIPEREKTPILDILRRYFVPLYNAGLGLTFFDRSLDTEDLHRRFVGIHKNQDPALFPGFSSEDFSDVYYTLLGTDIASDEYFVKEIFGPLHEKLLSLQLVRTSLLDGDIFLSESEIHEVRILILNILSKAAFQSAAGPAFHILGRDLIKSGLDESHLSCVYALGFMMRLISLIRTGVVRKNVESLIENNKRVSLFPEEEKRMLTDKLCACIAQTMLLQGFAQISGIPEFSPLSDQILNYCREKSGIGRKIEIPTFNDILSDRSFIDSVKAYLIGRLIESDVPKTNAEAIVKRGFSQVILCVPFKEISEFVSSLSAHLYLAGMRNKEQAKNLARETGNLLSELAPKALLQEKKLAWGFSLNQIDKTLLLQDKVLAYILTGFEEETYKSAYKKTIESLFAKIGSEESVNFLLSDNEKDRPPEFMREVLVRLVLGLKEQEIRLEDALEISENTLKYLLKSKQALPGFICNPIKIKILYASLVEMFSRFKLPQLITEELSAKLLSKCRDFREEFLEENFVDRVFTVLKEVLSRKIAGLESAIAKYQQEPFALQKGFFQDGLVFSNELLLSTAINEALVASGIEEDKRELLVSNALSDFAPESDEQLITKECVKAGFSERFSGVLAEIIGEKFSYFCIPSEEAVLGNQNSMSHKNLAIMYVVDRILHSKAFKMKMNESVKDRIFALVENAFQTPDAGGSPEQFSRTLTALFADISEINPAMTKEAIAELTFPSLVKKELFLRHLRYLTGHYQISNPEEVKEITDELYRTGDAFEGREALLESLKALFKEKGISEEKILLLLKFINPDICLENREDFDIENLKTNLSNIMKEKFSSVLSEEKTGYIADLFVTTLLGDDSFVQMMANQIEILMPETTSKNYKKLLVHIILENIQHATQTNFDNFTFNEMLTENGKHFLKLMREALLNNSGIDAGYTDRTIDLQI